MSITQRSTTVASSGLPSVAKKVYATLALGLVLASLMGGVALHVNLPSWAGVAIMIVTMIMIIAQSRVRQGAAGLVLAYSIMGLIGFSIGPVVAHYLKLPHGTELVMQALLLTGVIFGGLSVYAITSKRDFSFLGGFLFVGLILMLVLGIVAIFMHSHLLSMVYSAGVALVMSGYILFDTSRMMRSGEDDYLIIVTGLFLNIVNLFLSMLNLLGDD